MKASIRVAALLLSATFAFAQSPASPGTTPSAVAPHREHVEAKTALSLVVQKAPIKYPDVARNTGIQGKVELKIVVSASGDVTEVTVVSGDPALVQAAADAVKQWKYKPYLLEGLPVEMETEVSFNFQIKTPVPPAAPSVGSFDNNAYTNDYFDIFYPLSRDWVRQTGVVRNKLAAEGASQGAYVLLAAVHIPQDTDPLRADSSFTVLAKARSGTQDCKQYLENGASELQSQKEGKQKGEVSQFAIAGRDFYRADFEYRQGPDHRTFLCTVTKDFLLQWNIIGWSKQAIEVAVETLNSVTSVPAATREQPKPAAEADHPNRVPVSAGVTTGLLIKKVQPIYPPEARSARIEGTVLMQATINKTGDVVDLEVLSGPIELVVSAVNAVRKWKYRPYLLKGEPVAVQTQLVVNYVLRF